MPKSTVAVVTGASRGLGLALTRELLSSGAMVVTVARTHNAELDALAQQNGFHLQQVQADLSDATNIEAAAGRVSASIPASAERYLMLNNAGVVEPIERADGLSDAVAIQRAFNVNVNAVMVLSAAFLRATAGASDRRILNVSSGAGRHPTAGWCVYCATKAALDHYTRVLAQENHGVRIASLAPGVVDTDMQRDIRNSDPARFPDRERFAQLHQQGQLTDPETVARKIIHHLSSDAYGRTLLDDIRNYV